MGAYTPPPPSIHTHTPSPPYPHCGKPFVICIFICITANANRMLRQIANLCLQNFTSKFFSHFFLKNRSSFLIWTSLRDYKLWICEFIFVCRFILSILCTIHCFLFVVREKCFKQPCSERKQKDWASLMFNQLRNLDLSYSVVD